MPVIVELRTLYHHEEAVFVLIHKVHTFQCSAGKQVASFVGKRGIDVVGHAKYFAFLPLLQVFPCARNVISLAFKFVENITSVGSVFKIFGSAAECIVDIAV